MNAKKFSGLLATVLLLVLPHHTAQAASITVDGTACTLADAITAANTDTAKGGCPAGSGTDTITLMKDVVLAAALPTITSVVTIEGQGHKIDGNGGNFSVLGSALGGNLTLNQATVSGGSNTSGLGGGIYAVNSATVTLNSCTVSGNTAVGGSGGGIYAYNSATVTLNNSTISRNAAINYGGGIYAEFATIMLNSCTISGNSASNGGGIYAGLAMVTLKSSLISGNTATSGNEVYNTITADSHNLFGHRGETNAQAFSGFTPGTSDVNATSDGSTPTVLAAILSPLANNGGPTQTHALPQGSPAIDLDTTCSTGLTTDQRGYTRPVGAGCDAGAFEFGAVAQHVNMTPVYQLLLKR